jgi:hypothetical protein
MPSADNFELVETQYQRRATGKVLIPDPIYRSTVYLLENGRKEILRSMEQSVFVRLKAVCAALAQRIH